MIWENPNTKTSKQSIKKENTNMERLQQSPPFQIQPHAPPEDPTMSNTHPERKINSGVAKTHRSYHYHLEQTKSQPIQNPSPTEPPSRAFQLANPFICSLAVNEAAPTSPSPTKCCQTSFKPKSVTLQICLSNSPN